MWYAIQTVNGQEQQVCTWINQRMDHTLFERCFVPLYEDVWRKEGVGHISVKKTFAGYVFIKADQPEAVYEELRKIPRFANLLSDQPDQRKDLYPGKCGGRAVLTQHLHGWNYEGQLH